MSKAIEIIGAVMLVIIITFALAYMIVNGITITGNKLTSTTTSSFKEIDSKTPQTSDNSVNSGNKNTGTDDKRNTNKNTFEDKCANAKTELEKIKYGCKIIDTKTPQDYQKEAEKYLENKNCILKDEYGMICKYL